jgi:hypothetical protein
MKIITFADETRDVAECYKASYPDSNARPLFGPKTSHGQRYHELAALTDETRTRQSVAEIIGNDSWAEMSCDECGVERNTLIRFGDDPDYEARWQDLCSDCLCAGLDMLP